MNLAVRPQSPPYPFLSPIARNTLYYRSPLEHDLLIQSALDPSVRRLDWVSALMFRGREVRVAAPVVELSDGDHVMLLDQPSIDRDDDDLVAQALFANSVRFDRVLAGQIMREPLASTARVIWRQRDLRVDLGMRLALSGVFAEEAALTVDELCSRVPGPADPVLAVMALACAGLLRLDLSGGFNRNTIVRGPHER
jgi:hypothetical protein